MSEPQLNKDQINKLSELVSASGSLVVTPECSADALNLWAKDFTSWPSMQHLGFTLQFTPTGASTIIINPLTAIHRGGRGQEAVNGAIISGIVDGAIATVGFAHFPENICGTVQLSTSILRPVFGSALYAYGIVVKRTKQMVFCEARVFDSEWRLCATGTGIVAASDKPR
ncbi:MAG TPA: PaaI family thioesterase [Cellvibrio sp.]|nr:PaaI family thioesterase [Cellvibrio sp.]